MPGGRRLVDGRIVVDNNHHPPQQQQGISWHRALALSTLVLFLLASNPANEATTAQCLQRLHLDRLIEKYTGRQFSSIEKNNNSYYWDKRNKATNYGVATLRERTTGLEVGAAGKSWFICSFDNPEWGFLCRKLKSIASHPGVEWWRLPTNEPPVVLHRVVMLLMALACGAVACRARAPNDPLTTMFVPCWYQNPFLWLFQVWVDSNLLLYPVWERMYQVTTLQAASSPCRIVGNNDDLNFYAAVLVMTIIAAGVRLLTGHEEQSHGWLVFLVTVVGYWQGTQSQSQQLQGTIFEDPTETDLSVWIAFRLGWFLLANGLDNVGPALVTLAVSYFAGTAMGDYHYNQQVWQVWTQSWSNMIDDTLSQLFGRSPNYRTHY